MRIAFAALLSVAVPTAAWPQANETVAARLVVYRNRDYGPLTAQDLAAAQQCKDDFLAEAARFSRPFAERRFRPPLDLNGPGLDAAITVAAAISVCLAARGLEGLHVQPVSVPLARPLLR